MLTLIEDIRKIFDKEGVTLYSGRNVVKKMVLSTHDGDIEMVVKRFRCRNIFQRIGYTLAGKSKAHKAYDNALQLESLGFNTPKAYAYYDYKSCGLLEECFFISGIDNGTDLAERLPVYGGSRFSEEMASAFGSFVAHLHRAGVIHHDLNSTNVRFNIADDGEISFSLIDINRMDFYDGNTIPLNVRMENLTRFTGRLDVTEAVARAYAKEIEADVESLTAAIVKQKVAHDRAWKRRKALLHPIRTWRRCKEKK